MSRPTPLPKKSKRPRKPLARPPHVEIQRQPNGKMLGGITGKGFMPGKSGNPSGRPKRKTLGEAARAKLAEQIPGDAKGRTWAEVIIDVAAKDAITNSRAREFLRRLTEGDTIKIETWQDRIVALLKSGEIAPEEVLRAFADEPSLAQALFDRAGVPTVTGR